VYQDGGSDSGQKVCPTTRSNDQSNPFALSNGTSIAVSEPGPNTSDEPFDRNCGTFDQHLYIIYYINVLVDATCNTE
jgi:hypothetical protein